MTVCIKPRSSSIHWKVIPMCHAAHPNLATALTLTFLALGADSSVNGISSNILLVISLTLP